MKGQVLSDWVNEGVAAVSSPESHTHPPSAAGLRPELVQQNFDAFQRLAIIGRVCDELIARGCRTAVDVGGYPGLLADHLPAGLSCRAIIDLPACHRPEYARGSALALPLRDQAVDVALCADTLEHVGDPAGAARELGRVARRAVVISAPWKSEATDGVETLLDRWHRQITGCAHPWLSEHRELGLPRREEIRALFGEGGWGTAEFFCGGLAEWTLLQIAMLLADLLPAENMPFSTFNREYNAHWPVGLSTRIPAQPYRTVIVATRDPALAAALARAGDQPLPGPPLTRGLVLIDGLLTAVQQALVMAHGRAESFDAEYRERLEALTSQQAQEIEMLRAELERLRGAAPKGLASLAKRLVGRGPQA